MLGHAFAHEGEHRLGPRQFGRRLARGHCAHGQRGRHTRLVDGAGHRRPVEPARRGHGDRPATSVRDPRVGRTGNGRDATTGGQRRELRHTRRGTRYDEHVESGNHGGPEVVEEEIAMRVEAGCARGPGAQRVVPDESGIPGRVGTEHGQRSLRARRKGALPGPHERVDRRELLVAAHDQPEHGGSAERPSVGRRLTG
ncbi:MAG: hypothetical protein ACK559_00850, partial [bacterium]